ncbi:putative splicing factor 3A subunit 1 [Diplonema papillatum]|nr:putative splicing factor 3A subunit 1 [Diplonema papillatum]WGM49953.1 SF3A1 [Diplonema papillatum]
MTSVPKGIVGVIHPPPAVRETCDKTAAFVARNGKEFEAKLLKNEKGNEKLKFLEDSNPYHAYYISKVDEFRERLNRGEDISWETNPEAPPAPADGKQPDEKKQASAPDSKKPAPTAKAKKNPFPKDYTVSVETRIAPVDLEILRLTALFVAKNGKSFLALVAEKERNNPQFEFLKGSSPRFGLFQAFLNSYLKIVNPPKNLREIYEEELETKLSDLTFANEVLEWRREEEERKKVSESEAELERNLFQMIDWHDFVIVDTIEFPENPQPQQAQELPPPGDIPHELNAPEPLPTDLPPPPLPPDDTSSTYHVTLPPDAPPPAWTGPIPVPTTKKHSGVVSSLQQREDDANVVAGYVREPQDRKRKATVFDPSGQEIYVDAAEEHMRRSTINPQWHKQKMQRQQDLSTTALASGAEVHRSLAKMARHMPQDHEDDAFDPVEQPATGNSATK